MKMLALTTLALGVLASVGTASAQGYGNTFGGTGSNLGSHYVGPSINRNGTYTQGHYQTNPNNTQRDNFGTLGNTNPYTGQTGRSPRY